MNKLKFEEFIDKYSLNGEVDSVLIASDGEGLSTGIISADKSLVGNVSVKDLKFPEGEFGIFTTSQLKRMLGVLNDAIDIDVLQRDGRNTSLVFSDTGTKVQYMLAEARVIPQVPDLKRLPEFNVKVDINEEFSNTFKKAKAALKDVKTFTFISDEDGSRIVLGYSDDNSNRISIEVEAETEETVNGITFNSDYLKSILDVNGDSTSSMEISTDGLCRLQFTKGDFSSKYFIVENKS